MADRNPGVAIAFLVLVLMPQMVVSIKFGFKLNPRAQAWAQNWVRDFLKDQLKDHLRDRMFDIVLPRRQSQPTDNDAGSHGGQSQVPATTAGQYIFSFNVVGNNAPPQIVSGALDLNSDFVWTQCQPAIACESQACQHIVPQMCPAVNSPSPCTYSYTYNGGSARTYGFLSTAALMLGDSVPVNLIFGCDPNVGNFGGVIGIGKGPLSLVSQLGAGRFSYHLAPEDGTFLRIGDGAVPETSRFRSIRLLQNRAPAYANYYYVGLTDIQVDGQSLNIPPGTFDIGTTGSGGVILSTTIPVTILDKVAYDAVREALVSKIGSALQTVNGSDLSLDLCYESQFLATVPAMSLVFDGNVVMELNMRNYFYVDATTGLECLTIVPSRPGAGSVLGNLIQVGTHMIYDIRASMLMFESFEQQPPPPPLNSSKGSSSPQQSSSQGSSPQQSSSQGSSPQQSSSAPPVVVLVHFVWVMLHCYWAAF